MRAKNEDHFLVSKVSRNHEILLTNVPDDQFPAHTGDDGYSMFVADGMGGMAAGEVASRLAITTGAQARSKTRPSGASRSTRKKRASCSSGSGSTSRRSTRRSPQRSEADHRLFGMGTTLTVAYSVGVDLFIIHLGDSRAYLYRKGELQQLTKDHTVAQAMADAGYIAPEEVRHHRKRHVLTNFLGGHHGKVKADVRWLRLADGDRLLLCSDGLTDMVDDESIARILGEQMRTRRCGPGPARRGARPRRQGQRHGHRRPLCDSQPHAATASARRPARRHERPGHPRGAGRSTTTILP